MNELEVQRKMINPKAYTEVNEIIKSIPNEVKEKIPEDIRKTIDYNSDKNYYFTFDDFEKIELLEDTKKILSVLYTDYFSTEDERKVIMEKEKIIERQKEQEKRQKYPIDFLKNRKIKF